MRNLFGCDAAAAAVFAAGLALGMTAGSAAGQDEAPAEATDGEAVEAADAPPASFFSGWAGSVSIGLYGTEGNSDEFDVRAEADGERDTDEIRTTFLTTYNYSNNNNGVSENEARLEARNDWKFEDPRYFAFAEGQFDYDEFQDWDTRVSVFGGPGYVWVDTDKQRFMTRIGAGATREIGGQDNAWRAEGLLAAEYRRQLTERQLFNASAEAYPDLGDSRNWRVQSRATWEVLVDPEVNLTLQIGIENDYDTDPNGAQRSDTDYFILLSWTY